MKKNLKARLSLHRETLLALDADQMAKVAGGAQNSGFAGCITYQTCATNCHQWYCSAVTNPDP
jgi:hypothetical protein